MSENYKIEFIDYLLLLLKWKKTLVVIFLISTAVAYLGIRILIPEEFESTATIIPSADGNSLVGLSSVLKDFSSVLPAGLSGMKQESEMDMYNTVLFSRTSIELLIHKFDLQKLYKIKSRERAVKTIRKCIVTNVTIENAFTIKVRTKNPKLAADMTNYLVTYLNEKIICLHVAKSKDNRLFLEQRYEEIKNNVRNSEDSLKTFQERTGIFEASRQTMATIETFSKLESDLAVKQIEFNVLNKIYGTNSPQTSSAKISLTEYENTVKQLKSGKEKSDVIIGLNSLPKKARDYFNYYRDVKIYNEMLEFIVPLYEQSKFEEQKTIPIFQIIDNAVPAEKKAYPPRTLLALVIGVLVQILMITYLLLREIMSNVTNTKILLLKKEVLR